MSVLRHRSPDLLAEILRSVEYNRPGATFYCRVESCCRWGQRLVLGWRVQNSYSQAPDLVNIEAKSCIRWWWGKRAVIRHIMSAFISAEAHEAAEAFKVEGKRVFNPHKRTCYWQVVTSGAKVP